MQKCGNIQNYYSKVIVHVQMIFLFFFSLSPYILLFSSIFFSQQNHKITPALASTTVQGITTQIQNPKTKISNNSS